MVAGDGNEKNIVDNFEPRSRRGRHHNPSAED
jgi:hypothetical protein